MFYSLLFVTDCEEIRRMGFTTSGVYSIQPWNAKAPFEVYCEMDYYDGGWTLIQKRRDGTVNFDRLFNDYATGKCFSRHFKNPE